MLHPEASWACYPKFIGSSFRTENLHLEIQASCCNGHTRVVASGCLGPSPAAAGRTSLRVRAEQATKEKDSAARQLLGMKGAALETDIWKIRVQLTKPVTWIPLIWGRCAGRRGGRDGGVSGGGLGGPMNPGAGGQPAAMRCHMPGAQHVHTL